MVIYHHMYGNPYMSSDAWLFGKQECGIWFYSVGVCPPAESDWIFLSACSRCGGLYTGVAVTKLGFGIWFSTWSSVWFCQYQKYKENCRRGENIARLFTKMFLFTNHKPPPPTQVSWIHHYKLYSFLLQILSELWIKSLVYWAEIALLTWYTVGPDLVL